MLPLETKVIHRGWDAPALLKIAGLDELSTGVFPIERMALDLREVRSRGISAPALLNLPWAGFVADHQEDIPDRAGFVALGERDIVRPGDVVETQPWASKVAVRHRRGDPSNVLFATERCNRVSTLNINFTKLHARHRSHRSHGSHRSHSSHNSDSGR